MELQFTFRTEKQQEIEKYPNLPVLTYIGGDKTSKFKLNRKACELLGYTDKITATINFGKTSIGYADDDIYIKEGYEIVKFKDLEFKEMPKLYGYCFEDGVLEKQDVNILDETPNTYTVERTKFSGYHAKMNKKDINKVFYDYRYYGLFLEPDEQSFKIQVLSKLKNDIDKLQKEIDRRENDIKILEVW